MLICPLSPTVSYYEASGTRSHKRRSRWILPTLVIAIVFVSVTLAACVCDPYIHVDVENRTDEKLVVFDDGTQRGVIGPGDSGGFAIHIFEGTRTFTVKTLNGRVLASRTFTWDEILTKFEITIVVEE